MTPFTFIFSTYYQSRASKAELCKHAIPKGMSKKMFLRCLVYPPYAYNLHLSLVKAFSLPLFIQAKLMFLFTSRDYGLSILKGSDGNCVTSRFSHPFIHSHVASEFQIHLAPILAWIHYESSSGQPARRGSIGIKCHVRGGGSRKALSFSPTEETRHSTVPCQSSGASNVHRVLVYHTVPQLPEKLQEKLSPAINIHPFLSFHRNSHSKRK